MDVKLENMIDSCSKELNSKETLLIQQEMELNSKGKEMDTTHEDNIKFEQMGESCSKEPVEDRKLDVENGTESNEEEMRKVTLLRALVENRDPSCKELDDSTIRRFLRARDLDIEKASSMLLKYLKWKRMFVPDGYVSASEVRNEIAQNKMFMQGQDKKGRPIVVVLGARHFQNKVGGLDEFKRFVVFGLDKICSSMPHGQEKFVVIGDLQDWGYCNSDIRAYLGALSILQDYYPERLGKVYLIHVPYVFMTAWKIVYPFIDNKTKKKIIFVGNKRLKSTLLEDIDESQFPEIYGGRLPLVAIQDALPISGTIQENCYFS